MNIRKETEHVVNEAMSAGDAFPSKCEIIEVHVAELKQLFNAIDPSPFNDRDLDPGAEEFIVSWGRELPRDAPLGLLVHLERSAGLAEEAAVLRDAIHQFFSQRGNASRRQLRQLFRRGRISLLIGLAFLGSSIAFSEFLARWVNAGGIVEILRESLLIGGLRCGGPWKSFCTTGGRYAPKRGCSIDSQRCRLASGMQPAGLRMRGNGTGRLHKYTGHLSQLLALIARPNAIAAICARR